MTDAELSRILCRHDWRSKEEWFQALDTLAAMTEADIDKVHEKDATDLEVAPKSFSKTCIRKGSASKVRSKKKKRNVDK